MTVFAAVNSAAARQQRHRARERSGRVLVTVELDAAETIEMLIEAGLLDPRRDHFGSDVLAEAVERFLRLARHA